MKHEPPARAEHCDVDGARLIQREDDSPPAGMLGLILRLAARQAATRIARNRSHDTPLVLEVRDNTPDVG